MGLRRWIIISLIFCGACTAGWTEERQLFKGIKIGMKASAVLAFFDQPTAYIIPQPPLFATTASNAPAPMNPMGLMGPTGAMNSAASPTAPNTLIFLYNGQELELKSSGTANPANPMQPMNPRMRPGMPGMPGSPGMANAQSANPGLPIWAYMVRVDKLALDQKQLIYRINNTYSLGITISGDGPEAKVSDIVACSFEPFTMKLNNPFNSKTKADENMPVQVMAKRLNFFYPAKKMMLIAGTSHGVQIGSSLRAVLNAHGWPDGFFPLQAGSFALIPLGKVPTVDANATATSMDGLAGSAGGGMNRAAMEAMMNKTLRANKANPATPGQLLPAAPQRQSWGR